MRDAFVLEQRKKSRTSGDAIFHKSPPASRTLRRGIAGTTPNLNHCCNGAPSWLPCAETRERVLRVLATELEGIVPGHAVLLFGTLPDHAGESFQRHKGRAGISPFPELLDGDVIERLPAGAPSEQSSRNIYHVRRAGAFVGQRRAAVRAKTPHRVG